MAMPGLAKFFTGTPMASAINFLAGTEPENTVKSEPEKVSDPADSQRETILEMINSFCQTMNNQELGTMYMLLSEIEKDRQNLQRILHYITQPQPNPTMTP
jgi:hypothetical protein